MNPSNSLQPGAAWEDIVRQQVKSIRFGIVQIVVHESRVVQIEKTEKFRVTETDSSVLPQRSFPNRSTGGINQKP
jgi:hypothetical protein